MFPIPSPEEAGSVQAVAVAVVLRSRKDGGVWILISHRLPSAHLPDLWEFPGGKLLPGETGESCALRELAEETGVRAQVLGRLRGRVFAYTDRRVALEFFVCRHASGFPEARHCQGVRWTRPENLECYRFPVANAPVLDALEKGGWLRRSRPPQGME
jgi:A/G-specific adenine glycosylase